MTFTRAVANRRRITTARCAWTLGKLSTEATKAYASARTPTHRSKLHRTLASLRGRTDNAEICKPGKKRLVYISRRYQPSASLGPQRAGKNTGPHRRRSRPAICFSRNPPLSRPGRFIGRLVPRRPLSRPGRALAAAPSWAVGTRQKPVDKMEDLFSAWPSRLLSSNYVVRALGLYIHHQGEFSLWQRSDSAA